MMKTEQQFFEEAKPMAQYMDDMTQLKGMDKKV